MQELLNSQGWALLVNLIDVMNASSAVTVARPSEQIIDLLKKEHEGGVITGRISIVAQLIPGHLEIITQEIKRREDEEEHNENT